MGVAFHSGVAFKIALTMGYVVVWRRLPVTGCNQRTTHGNVSVNGNGHARNPTRTKADFDLM